MAEFLNKELRFR